MVALRSHQFGACASRFPDLLRDLVKRERELPGKPPALFDPARARILMDNRCDEFGVVPAYEWQLITSPLAPPFQLFPDKK
jgi:hypothetical protein